MKAVGDIDSRTRMHGELARIDDEVGFARFMRLLAAEFGFSAYSIIAFPPAQANDDPRIVVCNWPEEFRRIYKERNYLKDCPVYRQMKLSTAPVAWSADSALSGQVAFSSAETYDLFKRFGYTSGIFYPVHGADGSRAAIAFDGNRPPLTPDEFDRLGMLASLAYDVFHRLCADPPSAGARLSARELEVLRWAANGKTSAEMATILTLSDHTVNSYLNSAMRKLDCVNRTQLVAKALRLRLIS